LGLAAGGAAVKPVRQTKRGGPNVRPEERGDCWDACLASILEVPVADAHVTHAVNDWWAESQRVLAQHGYEALPIHPTCHPSGYWIAGVPSKNLGSYDDGSPVMHVIVMRGGEVAHDPSLGDRYAAGMGLEDVEVADGFVLVPLAVRSLAA
jgi:hypothetical protein